MRCGSRPPRGKRFETDFVILCTGFTVDRAHGPSLRALPTGSPPGRDRFTPPAGPRERGAGALPLSGAGLRVHRTRARHGAVAEGHPLLQPRRDPEPRQDQRRHPGGQRGRRPAGARHRRRVLCRGRGAALRGPAGVREARAARRRVDRRRGGETDQACGTGRGRPSASIATMVKWPSVTLTSSMVLARMT